MKQRILIIDDDKKLNKLLRSFCPVSDSRCWRPLTPRKGCAPFAIMDRTVVLDVMLPDMNGFEVCKIIRQSHAIPIIMLTARGEITDRIVGLELEPTTTCPNPSNAGAGGSHSGRAAPHRAC